MAEAVRTPKEPAEGGRWHPPYAVERPDPPTTDTACHYMLSARVQVSAHAFPSRPRSSARLATRQHRLDGPTHVIRTREATVGRCRGKAATRWRQRVHRTPIEMG